MVIGKLKHEAANVPIIKIIGLRLKMHNNVKDYAKGYDKANGIKQSAIYYSVRMM